jgi:hypothetical protein
MRKLNSDGVDQRSLEISLTKLKKYGLEVPITCGKKWENLTPWPITLENGGELVTENRRCEDCNQLIKRKLTKEQSGTEFILEILVVNVPKGATPCIMKNNQDFFQNWTGNRIRERKIKFNRIDDGEVSDQ